MLELVDRWFLSNHDVMLYGFKSHYLYLFTHQVLIREVLVPKGKKQEWLDSNKLRETLEICMLPLTLHS